MSRKNKKKKPSKSRRRRQSKKMRNRTSTPIQEIEDSGVQNYPKKEFTNSTREVRLPHSFGRKLGDAPAIEEIRKIYDFIRRNPGVRKGDIMKSSRHLGIRRPRLESRWQAIRVYLRNEDDGGKIDRLNKKGNAWITGKCDNEYGRFMRYWATDSHLDFTMPSNIGELYELTAADPVRYEPMARLGNLQRLVLDGEVLILDENLSTPPHEFLNPDPRPAEEDISIDIVEVEVEPSVEEPESGEIGWSTVIYKGVTIKIQAGSTIKLD